MARCWLTTDTNNVPSFSVMLSMIDAAQLLTYDNVTAPGSFSDMVSCRRHHTRRTVCDDWYHFTGFLTA